MSWIPIAIFIGFFVFFIIALITSAKLEKKRKQALALAAPNMGMQYFGNPGIQQEQDIKSFKLLSQGSNRTISNYMEGGTEQVKAKIFDYRYTTGSGKNRSTTRLTPICFESKHFSIPEFTLAPENFLHRIGNVFGYDDIDFEMYPEFSKKFLLKGENETAIRQLFHRDLITHLTALSSIYIEGHNNQLLIFEEKTRKKVEEFPSLFENGLRLAQKFMSSAP